LVKLTRPSGRPQWTGLTTFAATMMRAVQKECSMLWRSRGRHAVPSTLHLSWVKRKVRLAVNAVTGAHWPTQLWPPARALISGGVLGRFGAIPAPSMAHGLVARSSMLKRRRQESPLQHSKRLSFCYLFHSFHVSILVMTLEPNYSWSRFMGG
jgi:hypothetical protein